MTATPFLPLKRVVRRLVGERLYLGAAFARKAAAKLVRQAIGREPIFHVQFRCRCEDHQYHVCPEGLGPGSVVYSFGVGKDIRFELSLIKRFGVQVFAFDPSPVAVEWIQAQALPPELHFFELGVGTSDGTADFHSPRDVTDPNWSTVVDASGAAATARCPVRRLVSISRMLGHNRIDILKLDIEGAEYGVIEDWLEDGPEVHQFLVEFHHRMASVGSQKTRDVVRLLNSHGYRLFHVSRTEPEFSFIKV